MLLLSNSSYSFLFRFSSFMIFVLFLSKFQSHIFPRHQSTCEEMTPHSPYLLSHDWFTRKEGSARRHHLQSLQQRDLELPFQYLQQQQETPIHACP